MCKCMLNVQYLQVLQTIAVSKIWNKCVVLNESNRKTQRKISRTKSNEQRNLLRNISKLKITVLRIYKGRLHQAKPCSACRNMLIRFGFKKVEYSNENGEMVCEDLHNMDSVMSSGYLM